MKTRKIQVVVSDPPACPQDGAQMRLKTPNIGRGDTWFPFWGCVNWRPNHQGCDGTRPVETKDDAQPGFWETDERYLEVTIAKEARP